MHLWNIPSSQSHSFLLLLSLLILLLNICLYCFLKYCYFYISLSLVEENKTKSEYNSAERRLGDFCASDTLVLLRSGICHVAENVIKQPKPQWADVFPEPSVCCFSFLFFFLHLCGEACQCCSIRHCVVNTTVKQTTVKFLPIDLQSLAMSSWRHSMSSRALWVILACASIIDPHFVSKIQVEGVKIKKEKYRG